MSTAKKSSRILWFDVARGVALIAMAIYHFTWDLEFFGYVPSGMTAVGGWKIFARSIASSFLLLVGISLFLAHRKGVNWPSFWRRFAMVAGAALAITVVTYIATPGSFIFFGILHQIAFASLAGLLFLRAPPLLTILVGISVIVLPLVFRTPLLDSMATYWLGLAEQRLRSNDFVPVFPFFGAVLVGMGLAGIAKQRGVLLRLAAFQPGRWSRPLAFIGQHSLAFYLIHQPVLIGIVWLVAQFVPPSPEIRQINFLRSCTMACESRQSAQFCAQYCPCVSKGMFEDPAKPAPATQSPEFTELLQEQVLLCTASTEIMFPEEKIE
ncbi:MAG: heparan-alpha-glucosaminide N-acetyltransferase [Mesorhizobium sp.]